MVGEESVTTATVVSSVLLLLGLVPAVWSWAGTGTITSPRPAPVRQLSF